MCAYSQRGFAPAARRAASQNHESRAEALVHILPADYFAVRMPEAVR